MSGQHSACGHLPRAPRVHFVRTTQRDFLGAIHPRINSFNALGEAVILVRYFVLPRAESAATVNVPRCESRLNAAKCAIAVQRRYRIAVFQPGVPHVVNVALRADERCREQALIK
jgi:hypothetical protein